jgi:hypothetical protein
MFDQEFTGCLIFFIISISMLIYFYKRDKKRNKDSEEGIYEIMYRFNPYGLFVTIALASMLGIIVKILRIY